MATAQVLRRGVPASAVALLTLAVAAVLAAAGAPAYAQPGCLPPGQVIAATPWAQKTLAPERVWPLATGVGVVVAVLDSGVDAAHPQLQSHVQPGADFLTDRRRPGTSDCVGHGTAVASLIAAQPADGTGFRGIAPDATILPVTVSEKEGLREDEQGRALSPADFAEALRWAVSQGATVVNLSVTFFADYPEVRDAVRFALDSNVVVVAAVGNLGRDANPTPYPAAYDGVIGVGAIDVTGQVLPESGHGPFVGLVAPGDQIVAATPGHGHATWRGTSFATPFVAGVAALVRQYWPTLTARQVAERLYATASPAPGGPGSPYYGHGIIDPYRAVTERLAAGPPRAAPSPVAPGVDPFAVADRAQSQQRWRTALIASGAGGVIAVAVVTMLAVRRSGRRQHWRPTRAQPLRPQPEDMDDGPAELFDVLR